MPRCLVSDTPDEALFLFRPRAAQRLATYCSAARARERGVRQIKSRRR